ncbi:unnamed protein product [Pleuronectes platessa]|uniref:Uncharacterized protein n=1 Tax=Pleuronectes platessa TaxID=8262 RepID=A0A9N7UEU2_PLEPL|nr:unnamed protein product [Pleuronectes platessa]
MREPLSLEAGGDLCMLMSNLRRNVIYPVAQEDKRFVPYQKDKGLMPRKIREELSSEDRGLVTKLQAATSCDLNEDLIVPQVFTVEKLTFPQNATRQIYQSSHTSGNTPETESKQPSAWRLHSCATFLSAQWNLV